MLPSLHDVFEPGGSNLFSRRTCIADVSPHPFDLAEKNSKKMDLSEYI